MAEPITSERRVKATERQRQALELRKAGASFEAIADRLGYGSKSGAYQAVMSAIKRTLREPADEVRELEEQRLDALLLAIWPQATKGNQGAIDRALRIMERRARLLGLDKPAKLEHSGPSGGPIPIKEVIFERPAEVDTE